MTRRSPWFLKGIWGIFSLQHCFPFNDWNAFLLVVTLIRAGRQTNSPSFLGHISVAPSTVVTRFSTFIVLLSSKHKRELTVCSFDGFTPIRCSCCCCWYRCGHWGGGCSQVKSWIRTGRRTNSPSFLGYISVAPSTVVTRFSTFIVLLSSKTERELTVCSFGSFTPIRCNFFLNTVTGKATEYWSTGRGSANFKLVSLAVIVQNTITFSTFLGAFCVSILKISKHCCSFTVTGHRLLFCIFLRLTTIGIGGRKFRSAVVFSADQLTNTFSIYVAVSLS